MAQRIYSSAERTAQLRALERALAELVTALEGSAEYAAARAAYAEALARVRSLLAGGFTPDDLHGLVGAVPRLFHTHPHWMPPLEETAPGRWGEPEWYSTLAPLENRVVQAAEQLRFIGGA